MLLLFAHLVLKYSDRELFNLVRVYDLILSSVRTQASVGQGFLFEDSR
jgi:hypothetical protein